MLFKCGVLNQLFSHLPDFKLLNLNQSAFVENQLDQTRSEVTLAITFPRSTLTRILASHWSTITRPIKISPLIGCCLVT